MADATTMDLSLTISANDKTGEAFKTIFQALKKITEGEKQANAQTQNVSGWRKLTQSLGGATKQGTGLATTFVGMGRNAVSAGLQISGLASLLSVGGFIAATKASFDFGSSLVKLGEDTNFGIDQLQEMRKAAQGTRMSMEEVTGGLQHFREMGRNVSLGKDPAMAATLKDMGTTGEEVFTNTPAAFAKVTAAINAITDAKVKYEAEQKIFGMSGERESNFLETVIRDYDQWMKKATDARAISAQEAKALADGKIAWQDFGDVMSNIRNHTIIALQPAISEITKNLSEFFMHVDPSKLAKLNETLISTANVLAALGRAAYGITDEIIVPFFNALHKVNAQLAEWANKDAPKGSSIATPETMRALEMVAIIVSVIALRFSGLLKMLGVFDLVKWSAGILLKFAKITFGMNAATVATQGTTAAVGFLETRIGSALLLATRLAGIMAMPLLLKGDTTPDSANTPEGQKKAAEFKQKEQDDYAKAYHPNWGSYEKEGFWGQMKNWWNNNDLNRGKTESAIPPVLPQLYGPRQTEGAAGGSSVNVVVDFKNVIPGTGVDVTSAGPRVPVKTKVGYGSTLFPTGAY